MRAPPANLAALFVGHARQRVRGLALLLALCLVLAPASAPCATGAGGMAQDLLDAITKSPTTRQNESRTGASQNGPKAPAQPKTPVVPGAPAQSSQSDQSGQPLSLSGQQQNAAQPRQTPPRLGPNAPRQQVLALRHDGADRRILLTLPKAVPLKKGQAAPKLPVVIFLHGAGGSAAQAMRQTGLAARAAAAGFLAAFPEGLGPGDGQTWNAWTCCGYARDQRVDDVGFLSALINRLRADYGADPKRIYLAGFSNGAMLASRFALERPGVAAAIAVVAGYLPCDAERPAEALPVLILHGAQDAVARFAPTQAHPATGRYCEDYPAKAQVEHWARGMDLTPKPQVRDAQNAPLRIEDYGPGKKGGRGLVRFVIVKNGGHAWPGGPRERYRYCDLPSASLDATGMVLDFFRREPGGASAPAPAKQKAKAKR